MAFNPGKLDQKIKIERRVTATQNDFGEKEPAWETLDEPWAHVMEMSGREFLKGGQEASEKKVVFRIRFLEILETDRIVWEKRIYDIDGTKRIGRREWLEIFGIVTDGG